MSRDIGAWLKSAGNLIVDQSVGILILLFTILLVFVDTDLIEGGKLYIFILGVTLAVLSWYASTAGEVDSKRFRVRLDSKTDLMLSAQERIERKQFDDAARREELRDQIHLVRQLISEGVIAEDRVYDILQRDRFFILFCYQNIPDVHTLPNNIRNTTRNPSLIAVERLGFVKVGKNHNFYVLPADYLHGELRSVPAIEAAVRKIVEEQWEEFMDRLKNRRAASVKLYVREHSDPKNFTYLIASANIKEVALGHIGYNSFTRKFKDLIDINIDGRRLKREFIRKRHEIKDFIKSASYEILLTDIKSRPDKEWLLAHETEISRNLGASNLLDYANIGLELQVELEKSFPPAKARRLAQHISERSGGYSAVLRSMGIKF